MTTIPYVPSPNYSSRYGERVRGVVIHDTEGMKKARDCAAYFQRDEVNASSHTCIDDTEIVQCVTYDWAAWTLRNGNQETDNAEMCGGAYASWTRSQWLAHRPMIDLTARWAASRCRARGLPARWLSVAEVRDLMHDDNHPGGIFDHRTYTEATSDGTHWDVGYGFPVDVFMESVTRWYHGVHVSPQEDSEMITVYTPTSDPNAPYGTRIAWLGGGGFYEFTYDTAARDAVQAAGIRQIEVSGDTWTHLENVTQSAANAFYFDWLSGREGNRNDGIMAETVMNLLTESRRQTEILEQLVGLLPTPPTGG